MAVAYPLVLGLGGWLPPACWSCLKTSLRLPLDDELLAVMSDIVPIGLGIYWPGSVRVLSPARRKTAGFAAALGARSSRPFGFHATGGLFACHYRRRRGSRPKPDPARDRHARDRNFARSVHRNP